MSSDKDTRFYDLFNALDRKGDARCHVFQESINSLSNRILKLQHHHINHALRINKLNVELESWKNKERKEQDKINVNEK